MMLSNHNSEFTIVVHGGAWDIPETLHDAHLEGVEKAAKEGYQCLKGGATAVYAAIQAVRLMEDDPTFDAGYGSFLNQNGEVEMDAIIMDGSDLSFGAVAAIQNVKNPIDIAELVRSKSDHSFLAGSGALQFAQQKGVPFYPTTRLLVGRELQRYEALKRKKKFRTREFFESSGPSDTVGAVTYDRHGNIAVATSTGGTPNKLPGRVGDSPLIGSGAYADNLTGGASSTGWGESLMKVVLAKSALELLSRGEAVQSACNSVIRLLAGRVDGRGGIICLDSEGRAGYAFNTPYMARAIAGKNGIQHVGIGTEKISG